jgi:hypothetical protein
MNINRIRSQTGESIKYIVDGLWDHVVERIEIASKTGSFKTNYECSNEFIAGEVAKRLREMGFITSHNGYMVNIFWKPDNYPI